MRTLLAISILIFTTYCATQPSVEAKANKTKGESKNTEKDLLETYLGRMAQYHISVDELDKVNKTKEEWLKSLSSQEYYILFEHGTERSFTGNLLENKEKGVYSCKACKLHLFSSDHKFKSGTGWPSFFKPLKKGNVGVNLDTSYGMTRIEVHCARCNGHLGHVFDDGPQPTGFRYCINSLSLC